MKTAVFCNGYHLRAKNWEYVVWGDPPNYLGRVPTAICESLKLEAKFLMLGSATSMDENKRLECLNIFNYCRQRLPELEEKLKGHFPISLKDWFEERVQLDLVSKSIEDEVEVAARICAAEGIERLIFCTSPSMAPVYFRIALQFIARTPEVAYLKPNLMITVSETDP